MANKKPRKRRATKAPATAPLPTMVTVAVTLKELDMLNALVGIGMGAMSGDLSMQIRCAATAELAGDLLTDEEMSQFVGKMTQLLHAAKEHRS